MCASCVHYVHDSERMPSSISCSYQFLDNIRQTVHFFDRYIDVDRVDHIGGQKLCDRLGERK
jgi:hypothetical protein